MSRPSFSSPATDRSIRKSPGDRSSSFFMLSVRDSHHLSYPPSIILCSGSDESLEGDLARREANTRPLRQAQERDPARLAAHAA